MAVQSLEAQLVLERLEALERQNRQLRSAMALMLILAGSAAAMGFAKKARALQATEFLLKDSDGTTRAALRMGSAGPDLVFYDPEGKAARVLLGVLPSGPALGFYDAGGKTRVSLGITAKGANLTFNDGNDKLRAELGILEEGPNLMFLGTDGAPVYKAH